MWAMPDWSCSTSSPRVLVSSQLVRHTSGSSLCSIANSSVASASATRMFSCVCRCVVSDQSISAFLSWSTQVGQSDLPCCSGWSRIRYGRVPVASDTTMAEKPPESLQTGADVARNLEKGEAKSTTLTLLRIIGLVYPSKQSRTAAWSEYRGKEYGKH